METPIPPSTTNAVSTPTKLRSCYNSDIAASSLGFSRPRVSAYYGEKPTKPHIHNPVVPDSLLDEGEEEHSSSLSISGIPNVQLSGSKRDSFTLGTSSFIASKRRSLQSLMDGESEVSLCIEKTGLQTPIEKGPLFKNTGELSFHNYSSILSGGEDSSLLREANPSINFQSISFSDLHESDDDDDDHHHQQQQQQQQQHQQDSTLNSNLEQHQQHQQHSGLGGDGNGNGEASLNVVDVEMNLDTMSYSALLELEANQKGVLDDRWQEVHDEVLGVGKHLIGNIIICRDFLLRNIVGKMQMPKRNPMVVVVFAHASMRKKRK